MKRAYLDRALRYQPDRLADQSSGAREDATYRLGEINEAWAVLRNPATRARYDDERRSDVDAASSPTQGGADVPVGGATLVAAKHQPAEPQRLEPVRPVARTAAPRSRWWRYGPVIIGALVVAFVLVAAAVGSRPDMSLRVNAVERFAVGTCILVVVETANDTSQPAVQAPPVVEPVPCSGARSGLIVGKEPFPKPCPGGTSAVLAPEDPLTLCIIP